MTLKDFKRPAKKKPKNQDKIVTERMSKKQWKTYVENTPQNIENPIEREYKPTVITIERKKNTEDVKQKTVKPQKKAQPLVPEKTTSKNVSGPLVFGILLAVVVLMGLGFLAYDRNSTVVVPEFVGMNIDDVQMNNSEEFNFEIVKSYSPDTELGKVVNQSPMANSRKVKKGSTVRLTVNTDDYEVTVPVLTNMLQAGAENALKSLYLKSSIEIVNNDDYADGTVVSTEPSNGTKIKVNSTVKLIIAENSVSVPDLRGKTLQEATDTLTVMGLKIGEIRYEYSSEYETGRIAQQSTEPNVKVLKGAEVSITISQGEPVPVELTATVDLSSLKTPFTITVACDGEFVKELERTKYAFNSGDTYDISLTRNINEGVKTIEVYIDDELYQTYSFDFENAYVNLDATYEVSAEKSAKRDDSDSETESENETASSDTRSRDADSSESSSRAIFPQINSTLEHFFD